MFNGLKPILYGGREVWPLIEGGKGVSSAEVLKEPEVVCRAKGTCVTPSHRQRLAREQ